MRIAEIVEKYTHYLEERGFRIVQKEDQRPWGGYFVIDEAQASEFMQTFFADQELAHDGKLSPKILLVAPGKRLSWQYHHRRSEVWKCLDGAVRVTISSDDTQSMAQELHPGEVIRIEQGVRHRLEGLEDWGVVAEIWQHTDPEHPSDEDDIVRLQDDFGR
ncbi:MAG TPA: phosphoheptose isomerase [Bacteroidetes bacterium]|jgi:mannose-6-phosphate isomerase|nr:MAG: phosphoheptose isomerase [Sphingobacteriales bacterium BACL12 MAG-120802-bin5]KRP10827.1 MAG: phosphoheptose isomerase [Sphingobacteriales bacterium BACL12 MAG-120813-bin55]HCK20816.1 phosphoheptose isomerase [Bacteroidota bacterium]